MMLHTRTMLCMRTTLDLDDELLRRARLEAAAAGCTLTSLVEEGLAMMLERREVRRQPAGLPVWSGSRVIVPVDFDDSSSLWDLLDADGR